MYMIHVCAYIYIYIYIHIYTYYYEYYYYNETIIIIITGQCAAGHYHSDSDAVGKTCRDSGGATCLALLL